jgi:hypothetical protein
MVELRTKERDGDKAEHDLEDTIRYEKSAVGLASFGREEVSSVLLHTIIGPVSAVPAMVNGFAQNLLFQPCL